MPHPARRVPGPYDRPCFDDERSDAADADCRHEAQGRQAACRVYSRIRLFPWKAGGARRKWGGGRSAGGRDFRGGAIRIVRGRRVLPRRAVPPPFPVLAPPDRTLRPLDTRFRRFLTAGG